MNALVLRQCNIFTSKQLWKNSSKRVIREHQKDYLLSTRSYMMHRYCTNAFNSNIKIIYRPKLLPYTSLNICKLSPALSTLSTPLHNIDAVRHFRVNHNLYNNPSSKVEVTVQAMKNKQKEKVEEIIKEAANGVSASTSGICDATKPGNASTCDPCTKIMEKQTKKTILQRIWDECVHMYHGFRLLFIDVKVCFQLIKRVLNGHTLTRRENKLLVRTTSDVFRLIPFSVFLVVPFMEFLLPFYIKYLPGMMPSTFQTPKERDETLKQSLQVKLEMAKFLQQALDEMAVQHKEHRSEDAKQFAEFFEKIKNPNILVPSEEIIKYAKRFEDEVTIDSLSRVQLSALCRLLELNTMGTTNFLRFQLRVKLRSLRVDDRVIAREGVDSLDLIELQQACRARGMRAYGLTEERLRFQLQEWIDLSLNEKVPPTLLLLSRAIHITDDKPTTHKLKETLRVLPDSVAAQTKAAIGESEGKIDNKAKIEVIKDEERKIKEEREEEQEQAIAKAEAEACLHDKAPYLKDIETSIDPYASSIVTPVKANEISVELPSIGEKSISSKDAALLSEALKNLSTDKKMMVEKETIKDLKEELQEYKEDVEELHEVRTVVQEPVQESRAAKMLYKRVDSMLGQFDKLLIDLEKKQERIKDDVPDSTKRKDEESVRIDELMNAIKMLKQTSDDSRLKSIESVLSKIDKDNDGAITINEVFKVIEAISRDNVHLNEKQIEELLNLINQEQIIEAEEKIEKALLKSIKEAKKNEEQKLVEIEHFASCKDDKKKIETDVKTVEFGCATLKSDVQKPEKDELIDKAPILKDKAIELNEEKGNLKLSKQVLGEKKFEVTETSPDATQIFCTGEAKQHVYEPSSSERAATARETGEMLTKEALLQAADKQQDKILPKTKISAIPPTIPPTISSPSSTTQQVNRKDKGL